MQHLARMTLTDCSNGFHFFELWHIHLFLRVYYFIHLAASLPAPACLSQGRHHEFWLGRTKNNRRSFENEGFAFIDTKSMLDCQTVLSMVAPLYLLHRLYGFSSPNKLGCLGYGIWCSGFYTAGQNRFHNSSLLRLHSETGLLR